MTGLNPPLNPFRPGAILARMYANLPPAETLQNVLLTELIQRIADGDEAALGRFYDATLSRVYGLAMKITGRRELAEEVSVETFWQVWREASRFDAQRGEPLAWLMVMARSRALDALRRLDRASSCAEPEIHLECAASPDGSPLDLLLQTERDTGLGQALATLSPIQRQLVALAFYKDLSHQEISDRTGLPLGTVKSHLKRAQDALRTALCRA